jgi:hypothetical protein
MNAKNVILLLVLVGAVFAMSACDTQLGHSDDEHHCGDGHDHEGCDEEHDEHEDETHEDPHEEEE